jgi:hypothetical protein
MERRPRVCLGLASWDEHAARTAATYEHAFAPSGRSGRSGRSGTEPA